jgi:hypothetical protein
MPEFGIGFQVSPFLFERDRDGNADIAAKRLSGGVVLPADLTAVLLTDGGRKASIEVRDVELGFVGHERDFTSKNVIYSHETIILILALYMVRSPYTNKEKTQVLSWSPDHGRTPTRKRELYEKRKIKQNCGKIPIIGNGTPDYREYNSRIV